jgi:hypothetical protein
VVDDPAATLTLSRAAAKVAALRTATIDFNNTLGTMPDGRIPVNSTDARMRMVGFYQASDIFAMCRAALALGS